MTRKKARLSDASSMSSSEEMNPAMFSAASFAGVLGSDTSGSEPSPVAPSLHKQPVVAFYGFRGGAGRTTALAHFAAELSARSVSTVAIDLDVEAPGLHHVLDCPEPDEDRGTVALLRRAATVDVENADARVEALRLAPHILKSGLDVGAPIRVIPAGRLSNSYLERLEDLGVPLWHIGEPPSPLEALLHRVRDELNPDIILVDCRTGLSGLSASALFHLADVVVFCAPVSEQSLDGLDLVIRAIHAARAHRAGLPELLIVPTMVPEGPEGQRRLKEWFIPEIVTRYSTVFREVDEDEALDSFERTPVVSEGIEYRRGIALADHLRADFVQRASGVYQPMTRELDRVLGLDRPTTTKPDDVNALAVLKELESSNLHKLAFAEEVEAEDLVSKFIRPNDFRAIADPTTWYVVGAKGAGKTWMWRYLLSDVAKSIARNVAFLAGHGPKDAVLSPNAFREVEADRKAGVVKRHLHGTTMLLYAAYRLLHRYPEISAKLSRQFRGEEGRAAKALGQATSPDRVQAALISALMMPKVGTFAEQLIREIDSALLMMTTETTVLLYDDLDVGFGSDSAALERRRRFVSGFVEAIEPLRGACKRIAFKLFLREDVFAEISIQNQSHLGAATIELKWEAGDIWALVLNVVSESETYRKVMSAIEPTASLGSWPPDEERRLQLLIPLWGDQMERGKKIQTGRYIQRRTADGKGRLFPRTVIQLLAKALESQRGQATAPDRVLRSAAVQHGYIEASKQRVADLRKEYKDLEVYLDAFAERPPTGTEAEIIAHLKKAAKREPVGARRGAAKGALHAGPGGWAKVIPRLLEVGVIREYKRARGEDGQTKYEVALLYRPGLGIKQFGV